MGEIYTEASKDDFVSKRANDLENATVDYLSLMGWLAWPQNNVGIYDSKIGKMRKRPKRFRKGVPDVLAVQPDSGRLYGFEIKTENDRMSEHQKQFQADLEQVKAVYVVVREIGDVIDAVTQAAVDG